MRQSKPIWVRSVFRFLIGALSLAMINTLDKAVPVWIVATYLFFVSV